MADRSDSFWFDEISGKYAFCTFLETVRPPTSLRGRSAECEVPLPHWGDFVVRKTYAERGAGRKRSV